jgi:hypothetical protein
VFVVVVYVVLCPIVYPDMYPDVDLDVYVVVVMDVDVDALWVNGLTQYFASNLRIHTRIPKTAPAEAAAW